jgi:NAD(P)-dependent dehydrogenase (short-subunit alcohol dehydrogenase family)
MQQKHQQGKRKRKESRHVVCGWFPDTMLLLKLKFLLVTACTFISVTPVRGELPISIKNVIVVGGSSGMGKAAALATVQRGGTVMLVGRTESKLSRAKEQLLEQKPDATIFTRVCDVSDESAVEQLAKEIEESSAEDEENNGARRVAWNGLVVSAAGKAPHGPVLCLPTSATRDMMESKVWTAYHCAKHLSPKLQPDSSVVFVAGILNRRPGMNCAPLAMANGALEGLTRSLALEWGPRVRVNCLSPGFCDTERFDDMDPGRKGRMLANTAASLPLQKVGQPSDMGEAIFYLLTAPFCTGVILDVDGGHGIRQYANPNTDPMRK